jgi:hypothetical protein
MNPNTIFSLGRDHRNFKVLLLASVIFFTFLLTIPIETTYAGPTTFTYPVVSGSNTLNYTVPQVSVGFDKNSWEADEKINFWIYEQCQNENPTVIDFFPTTVTQPSSITTVDTIETNVNTGNFTGMFNSTDSLVIPTDEDGNVIFERESDSEGSTFLSWDMCTPLLTSNEVTVGMSTTGNVTISSVSAEKDDLNLSCEIRAVTDIIDVKIDDGTITGDNFVVTMSYENGVFFENDREDFLNMFYQKPGFGWAQITDHSFDPDDSSIDVVAKTVTSDPIDAGIGFQISEGRYVVGYNVGCAGGGGGGLVRPSLVVNALAGLGGAGGGGSAYSSPQLHTNKQPSTT